MSNDAFCFESLQKRRGEDLMFFFATLTWFRRGRLHASPWNLVKRSLCARHGRALTSTQFDAWKCKCEVSCFRPHPNWCFCKNSALEHFFFFRIKSNKNKNNPCGTQIKSCKYSWKTFLSRRGIDLKTLTSPQVKKIKASRHDGEAAVQQAKIRSAGCGPLPVQFCPRVLEAFFFLIYALLQCLHPSGNWRQIYFPKWQLPTRLAISPCWDFWSLRLFFLYLLVQSTFPTNFMSIGKTAVGSSFESEPCNWPRNGRLPVQVSPWGSTPHSRIFATNMWWTLRLVKTPRKAI